ncbi:hypothetical protein TRIUR3_10788 [Triticum urartu]|uniref:Uncharacterized protein n=1 Tax=Triticum urartu TaxID=4572 RepID=M8AMB0_TRIUA|nr:hypothetical protein TRIUR3_10788 [Triticum urartu]
MVLPTVTNNPITSKNPAVPHSVPPVAKPNTAPITMPALQTANGSASSAPPRTTDMLPWSGQPSPFGDVTLGSDENMEGIKKGANYAETRLSAAMPVATEIGGEAPERQPEGDALGAAEGFMEEDDGQDLGDREEHGDDDSGEQRRAVVDGADYAEAEALVHGGCADQQQLSMFMTDGPISQADVASLDTSQSMLSAFEEEREDVALCLLMHSSDITGGMRSSPAPKQMHLPRNGYGFSSVLVRWTLHGSTHDHTVTVHRRYLRGV